MLLVSQRIDAHPIEPGWSQAPPAGTTQKPNALAQLRPAAQSAPLVHDGRGGPALSFAQRFSSLTDAATLQWNPVRHEAEMLHRSPSPCWPIKVRLHCQSANASTSVVFAQSEATI